MLNAMGLTTCVVLPMIFLFKFVVYISTRTTFYHSAFKLHKMINHAPTLVSGYSKMTKFGELTFGDLTFGELTFGDLTFGEMTTVGEMTLGNCHSANRQDTSYR